MVDRALRRSMLKQCRQSGDINRHLTTHLKDCFPVFISLETTTRVRHPLSNGSVLGELELEKTPHEKQSTTHTRVHRGPRALRAGRSCRCIKNVAFNGAQHSHGSRCFHQSRASGRNKQKGTGRPLPRNNLRRRSKGEDVHHRRQGKIASLQDHRSDRSHEGGHGCDDEGCRGQRRSPWLLLEGSRWKSRSKNGQAGAHD